MPRHKIGHPYQHEGLRDVATGHNEEECEVFDASGKIVLG
jgi:hypothetical protein